MAKQEDDRSPQLEDAPSPVQAVEDRLLSIDYQEVQSLLEGVQVDPVAGIAIVPLKDLKTEDGADRFPSVTVGKRVYNFYLASVAPGSAVNPHYHAEIGDLEGQTKVTGPDAEPYAIYSAGEMNTAPVIDPQTGQLDPWKSTYLKAEAGKPKLFTVPPRTAHSLKNPAGADGPLVFAFACPDDHLSDYDLENPRKNPDGNRVMTGILDRGTGLFVPQNGIKGGIPPSYPQQR